MHPTPHLEISATLTPTPSTHHDAPEVLAHLPVRLEDPQAARDARLWGEGGG